MPDILHVVDINAPLDTVFETVGTVAGIRRWWSADIVGSDELGGQLTIRFGSDWKVVMKKIAETPHQQVTYRVTEHDSNEWPGTELCFELTAAADWTILKFDQRGWTASTDFFRFCSAKWVVFLLSIKQAAETGTGTPYPNERKIGRLD